MSLSKQLPTPPSLCLSFPRAVDGPQSQAGALQEKMMMMRRKIPSWIASAGMECPSLLTPWQAGTCVQPDPCSPPHFSYLLIFPPEFFNMKKI